MAILTTLSFSELPSPKIRPFSSISRCPALLISSRIRRNSSNLVARHRRRAHRKNPPVQPRPPPGNDMSTAVQMPAAPRRWDEDHDRLLNSMGKFHCVDFFLPNDCFRQFTPIVDAFVLSLRNLWCLIERRWKMILEFRMFVW
ncbi:hypothetical protein ACJRO7_010238 [Eucalyptus globulus]|uniref:Uncharacterized protein n=1 Tax=Eucalyptus globulus TaxID=34317 RepID=A0ABD3LCH8_EUCGL